MNGFLLTVGLGGLVVPGFFAYLLKKYQTKELREKRTLDLQILALDDGAEFREKDNVFTEKLARYHLGCNDRRTVRNIRSKEHGEYTTYFFDFSLSAGEDSRPEEDLHGIVIELVNCQFPRFHIVQKKLFGWFNISGYSRLPKRFRPSWLPHTTVVFADEIDYLAVYSQLVCVPELNEILSMQNFEKMLFRPGHIAIYFQGQLPADLHHYQQQLNKAERIAHLFDPILQSLEEGCLAIQEISQIG